MENVLLLLERNIIRSTLARDINDSCNMQVLLEHNYNNIPKAFKEYYPDIAVIEMHENYPQKGKDPLEASSTIKGICPSCKVILLCPENISACVEFAVNAKKTNKIDDFVFANDSFSYLISKLESFA